MGAVKIMFASLGAYGHLYPMMPLAIACADAGQEVLIATGKPFLERLPVPTVTGYPETLELDWAIEETRRRHPDLHGGQLSMAMFADETAEQVTPTMIRQCERIRSSRAWILALASRPACWGFRPRRTRLGWRASSTARCIQPRSATNGRRGCSAPVGRLRETAYWQLR